MTKIKPEQMEVEIFKSDNGEVQIEVNIKKNTVWLSQAQIAELFAVNRPAITKHLRNIFQSNELVENSVCSKMEHTAKDGKRYLTKYFNLDAIISVGYRVNSQKATQFRIWATKVLKQHLMQGYSINRRLLSEQKEKLNELKLAVNFIESKSHQKLLESQSQELLSLVKQYTRSIDLLDQYDRKKLRKIKGTKPIYVLSVEEATQVMNEIKSAILKKEKEVGFFGTESSDKFSGIIRNIYQTFDGVELYRTAEEKAANLLYIVIKDHPFIDGNKRTGSILFVHFLSKNNMLYRQNGEKKINDNTLVALALLVAISDPQEKEILIKVIIGLLAD